MPRSRGNDEKTSPTEFGHQMPFGHLLTYLSLNGPQSGLVLCCQCSLVQFYTKKGVSQKKSGFFI